MANFIVELSSLADEAMPKAVAEQPHSLKNELDLYTAKSSFVEGLGQA